VVLFATKVQKRPGGELRIAVIADIAVIARKSEKQKPLPLINTDDTDPNRGIGKRIEGELSQSPGHSRRGGGAEQVYQIVIEPAPALKDRAQKAIDYGAEKAGQNDHRNRMDRHEPC
jgi:hypothetical protein